jgi:hypothetical protein
MKNPSRTSAGVPPFRAAFLPRLREPTPTMSERPGAKVIQWPSTGGSNQDWQILAV